MLMSSDNLPRLGFCISNNRGLFIANDSIKTIEIKSLDSNSDTRQILINDRVVYQVSTREIDVDHFIEISNNTISKLIEHIRFNSTSNINIDDLFLN